MIPAPDYTILNTSIGDDPAVVVMNTAMALFEDRHAFPWHLKVTLECKQLEANGMPTAEEGGVLNVVEDELTRCLEAGENAVFLVRTTCRGKRSLVYRVQDAEVADGILQQLISRSFPIREWDYCMQFDADWKLAEPELNLLRRSAWSA